MYLFVKESLLGLRHFSSSLHRSCRAEVEEVVNQLGFVRVLFADLIYIILKVFRCRRAELDSASEVLEGQRVTKLNLGHIILEVLRCRRAEFDSAGKVLEKSRSEFRSHALNSAPLCCKVVKFSRRLSV